jgi:hypothetical protein
MAKDEGEVSNMTSETAGAVEAAEALELAEAEEAKAAVEAAASAVTDVKPAEQTFQEERKSGGSGFWEGAEKYLEFDAPEPVLPEAALVLPRKRVSDRGPASGPEPVAISDETERAEEKLASSAVTEEIRQLRRSYIVGKLAGEALRDSSGRLIVGKYETITEKVLLQAERSGKLSELVIHMIFPGLDDV